MVDDKSTTPDEKRPGDSAEGVRIIGAEEAAEALERGDIAARRGDDQPRYGDRPTPPPVGPRPALRFPLGSSDDPSAIDKPAVRPTTGIEFEPLPGVAEPGRGQRFDPITPGGAEPEAPEGTEAPEQEYESDAAVPGQDVTLDEPLPSAGDEGSAADVVPPDEDFDSDEFVDEAPSTPVEMPHWSEPPTGEVPRVIVGEETEDDLDAWSSFASSSPRWRDSDRDWHEDEGMQDMLGSDGGWKVGAMDDSRPTEDELYSFEDLEHDTAAPAAFDDRVGPELDFHPDPGAEADLETPAVVIGARGRRAPGAGARQARNPVADYASGGGGYAHPGVGRDVGTAVAVGVGLVVAFLVLSALGPKFVMVLVVAALAAAAVEYFNAVRRAGYQPAVLVGLVAAVAAPLAVYWKGLAAYPIVMVLTVVVALLWYLVGAEREGPVVEGVGTTLLGVGWIAGLGSFAALMLHTPGGLPLMQLTVFATVAYDVGAFFVGRSAGSRPLSEASPNKTVEGLVGGMLMALVVAVVYGIVGVSPLDSVGACAVLGLVVAFVAPVGDLCESLLKRDLGIKDMGSILPEHGGVLDRCDALLFALPAVFYAAVFFHLGPFS